MTENLHPELTALLLRPINPRRVFKKDGQSHLAAWDVRAHLIRCFGFAGWSAETTRVELIHDIETTTKANKPARKVAYRAQVRLTIHATGATYTEWAVGESTMPDFKHGDAHDFALKTAESQALKRCAINLGSQFGLSLYDNGSHDDVVKGVFSVRFSDDVTVTDEGQEPGVVAVDEETGEIHETPAASEGSGNPSGAATSEGKPSAAPDRHAGNRDQGGITDPQLRKLGAMLNGYDRDARLALVSSILGRAVGSAKDLTQREASRVIDHLVKRQADADDAAARHEDAAMEREVAS